MNPDAPQSPRDELEAKLTALLLGELPDAEAAELRRQLAGDAELARLHDRLAQTVGLVREATASPADESAAQPAPLRLADARREKLLAHFKTLPMPVAAKPAAPARARDLKWLAPLGLAAAAVLVIGLGLGLVMPRYSGRVEMARLPAITLASGEAEARLASTMAVSGLPLATDSPSSDGFERRLGREKLGEVTLSVTAGQPRELAPIALTGGATLLSPSSSKKDQDGDKNVAAPMPVAHAERPVIVLPPVDQSGAEVGLAINRPDTGQSFGVNVANPRGEAVAAGGVSGGFAVVDFSDFAGYRAEQSGKMSDRKANAFVTRQGYSIQTDGLSDRMKTDGGVVYNFDLGAVPAAPAIIGGGGGGGSSTNFVTYSSSTRSRPLNVALQGNNAAFLALGSTADSAINANRGAIGNVTNTFGHSTITVNTPMHDGILAFGAAEGVIHLSQGTAISGTPNGEIFGTGGLTVSSGNARNYNSAGETFTNGNVTVNALRVAGGTLDLNGQALTNNSGAALFTGDAPVINGAISGIAALTKSGAGTLVLGGANTYTGGTVINAGTLMAGNNTALGSGAALTYGGVISGAGGLTMSGSNALVLNNGNTFSGALAVNKETERRAGGAAVELGTGNLVVNSGATLDLFTDTTLNFARATNTTTSLADGRNWSFGRPENLGALTVGGGVNTATLTPDPSAPFDSAHLETLARKGGKSEELGLVVADPQGARASAGDQTFLYFKDGETKSGAGAPSAFPARAVRLPETASAKMPAPAPVGRELAELRGLEVSESKLAGDMKGSSGVALGDVPFVGRFFRLDARTAHAGATIPGAAPAAPAKAAKPAINKPMPAQTELALADLDAPQRKLSRQTELVRDAEKKVDDLRRELGVTDPSGDIVGGMTLEPEALRRILAMRIEAQAASDEISTLAGNLKQKSREELKKSITTAVPDGQLVALIEQKDQAEQKLATLRKDLGNENPEVERTAALAQKINTQVDDRLDGIMAGLDVRAASAKARADKLETEVEKFKGLDIETAKKNRRYFEAKSELAKAEQIRDTLNLKAIQETIDTSLPKTSLVVITDKAEPAAEKLSTWGRFKNLFSGGVERSARVAIEKDVPDVGPLASQQAAAGYDPYFLLTEAEKIQSKSVLYVTIDRLKLNEEWAEKSGSSKPLTTPETYELLKKKVSVNQARNTDLLDIKVKSDKPEEAAKIANTIAEVYRELRLQQRQPSPGSGMQKLNESLKQQEEKVAEAKLQLAGLQKELGVQPAEPVDAPLPKPAANAPIPQPEILARDNAFSTFSLNVSDVSFKLAAASLEQGQMPDPASVRSEEFINAFDYRDPEAAPGVPVAFAWERARYPFAHNRDLLRFSVKTAAAGRQSGRPLNLVLAIDNSGSMERADRVRILREALRVLGTQLHAADKLSVITFARTPRLWVDGAGGETAGEIFEKVGALTPEGGTNLEEALNLAYRTALRHYLTNGLNRVVLLTDGAANLGDVDPAALKQKVEAHRKQGVALDCFGIGWDGFNDDLLEVLSRNGDGRYGFLNSPEEAATDFAGQLAGALQVAASDVKVQVEFNPKRVTSWRQIGYAKHQLTKEQFRDNTVDAAELAAQEAGNALYTIEANPAGIGPVATVRVRFKIPGTSDYREHAWDVPFTGNAVALEQSSPAMRLAATASAFSEWLAASPFAAEVAPNKLLNYLSGVPEIFGADARPKKLEWMIRQAKSVGGK
ncbi:MAG: von Willebrand factor type A domain-containing protein [Verrucomicrobia bacterium]|nr:von Willebrand factor type A domain-containing protein [Verrucomicrobiota bacterium]